MSYLKLNYFVSAMLVLLVIVGCGDKKQKNEESQTNASAEELFEEKTGEVVETDEVVEPTVEGDSDLEARMALGKEKYAQTCFACHQAEGQGVPGAFPPLAKSDYLNADVARAIDIVLNGKSGEITVNGTTYNSVMTAQNLSDEEVLNVLTYVYNSWGNDKQEITLDMIKSARK
ncbi:MAG: c-type cytochrome [Flavobacteriales bacterium]|nr:c-type cytochrome [Flavobacteriales bacterium]